MHTRSLLEQEEELLASQPADLSSASEVTAYRSTWIMSSFECLRSLGVFDRYCAELRRIDREETPGAEEVLSAVANTWLPISIARAHYRACDTLGVSDSDMLAAMITADGGQVRRSWHAQIIAAAQKPDAAPWLLLPQIPKWWPRSAQGGGMALYRQGPTQARVQYRGCSLCDIPFYRDSSRGVLFIFVSRFCQDLKITNVPNQKPGCMSFQLRWR